jgi:4-hydroxy-tetrahydrodipicolinate synthase
MLESCYHVVTMKNQEIFGLSAALITPFTTEGPVDLSRLLRHARHVLAEGCDSITLFGTTGEGFSIGMQERARMMGTVIGGGIRGEQLYAGVSATTIIDAVDQAQLALDFGARGLLLAPPFYFKDLSEDGLYAWFSRVIEGIGAAGRGIILYHIPGQTAVPLSVDLVGRLKRAFPGVIAGVKDSSGDKATAEAFLSAHGELAILVGDERQLAEAMRKGAQGSICGLANLAPWLLRDAIHNRNDNALIAPIVNLITSYPVLPAVKALVAHLHGDEEYVRMRAPLVNLPAPERAALVRSYQAILAPGLDRKRA